MGFTKLEKLLGRSIKKAGLSRQIQELKILEDFSGVIEVMFEAKTLKKVKPLYFKDGTLVAACLSSVLAEKLKSHETSIIKNLNRIYQQPLVRNLRFLV